MEGVRNELQPLRYVRSSWRERPMDNDKTTIRQRFDPSFRKCLPFQLFPCQEFLLSNQLSNARTKVSDPFQFLSYKNARLKRRAHPGEQARNETGLAER